MIDGIRSDVGELLVGTSLRVIIVVAVAVILQIIAVRFVRRVVDHAIANAQRKRGVEVADGPTSRTAQRAHAIGSLVISVLTVVIWANAVLIVLELLGINIAPIIASAGIAGIALAFGAQTLIKDYLSGVLMILEDQFGVGDDVELTGIRGTVEEVTLRVTRVRAPDGVLWHIRNGEILSVGNHSQPGRG